MEVKIFFGGIVEIRAEINTWMKNMGSDRIIFIKQNILEKKHGEVLCISIFHT